MTRLVVEGLHKAFGDLPVLQGVDLAVPDGRLVAILGSSGSGKTTLLRVVAGFERADAGTVTLGNRVVDDGHRYVPSEQRRVGYVAQDGRLFPHLTVAGNIGFGLRDARNRDARVRELLEIVGLGWLGKRYPHQLSGGQQQRVALARALAIRPEVVLLDEPFAALDAGLRASVRADVLRIVRDAGTTAVMVTHDQDEALSTADLVAVLRRGRIVQCGTPHEVYTCPADAELAHFVGEANLVPGTLGHEVVTTPFGALALRTGGGEQRSQSAVQVLIRPEQIELRPGLGGPGVLGTVVGSQYHGHDLLATVRPDAGSGLESIVSRCAGADVFQPGDAVMITARGPVVAWPLTTPTDGDLEAGAGRSQS